MGQNAVSVYTLVIMRDGEKDRLYRISLTFGFLL